MSTIDWAIFAFVLCSFLSFLWVIYQVLKWTIRSVSSLFRSRDKKQTSTKTTKRKASRSEVPQAKSVTAPEAPKTRKLSKLDSLSSFTSKKDHGSSWVKPGSKATVARRSIGGMVYVGKAPTDRGYGTPDNAFIDPQLSVSKTGGDWEGSDLSYWPNYSLLTPRARATYLDWLSEGRKRIANPGYMFLYFYGLERRYFRDEPGDEEKRIIVAEVHRLLKLFGEIRSAARYLGAFLDAAEVENVRASPPQVHVQGDLPLSLKVGLARQLEAEKPLNAAWLRAWYFADSETRLRTPARRCHSEYVALFDAIFDRDYPKGLPIRRPKRKLTASYRAASGWFEADLTNKVGELPDVSSLRKPLTVAAKISEEATAGLEKFSRLLGKNENARGSLAAHALLPVQIRNQFPCAEADEISAWALTKVDQGGLVDAADFIERLTGVRPDKLTRKCLIDAADSVFGLGIGMAPDPRFALRSPKLGEPIILFELPPAIHVLNVSDQFSTAALRVGIATMIAQVDNVVDAAEEAVIDSIVNDSPGLTESERVRLIATARWMRAVPPDIAMMRKKMKSASEPARAAFVKLAVDMAAVDGNASKEEVSQLEKLYKTLGLDTAGLYSALHSAVSVESDEPVTMRSAVSVADGPLIPAEKAIGPDTINLDLAKVARIGADTQSVSALLGDIFGEEESLLPEEDAIVADQFTKLQGLTPAQTTFARELAQRSRWTDDEFAEAARAHGLMVAGALEAINEWSFAAYDRVYIDEYDGYDIDPEIAAEVGE